MCCHQSLIQIACIRLQKVIAFRKFPFLNRIYRCKNFFWSGVTVAYNQPINYASLEISHKYTTPNPKDHEFNSINYLKWSPDYRVLCVLYDNGSFCLYSVFGSLLYDSKELLYFTLQLNFENIIIFIKQSNFKYLSNVQTQFSMLLKHL